MVSALIAVADLHAPELGWSADGISLWESVGSLAPWLLLVALLLLILRAVLRQPRYRALAVLDASACERVHAALVAAERRTVGEILPVVVERSDLHPGAPWLCALTLLLLGTALAAPILPFDQPALLLSCQVAFGAVGYALAWLLPDLRRLFVREARADAVVEEQALLEFHRNGLHETEGRTGVLLFVSLFEHRVVVLGDVGIDAHLSPDDWAGLTSDLLAASARGQLADGLVAAVQAAGEALARHVPWAEGDRNEIPDRLVVRRE